MISAVVFDWGGVLIDNPSSKLASYCASFFHVSEKRFLTVFEPYEPDFQKGLLTEAMLWERVCATLGVALPLVSSLWEAAFRYAYVEQKKMFLLASTLKKKGYTIGFLSNTEAPAMNVFFDHHYDVFDVTVFSCAEGVRKPDPQIYQILLKRLKKQPDETLFIDDRQKYVDGARAIGMHSVVFTSLDSLLRDLSTFSIPVEF